jgi:Fanconi anemia group M protein
MTIKIVADMRESRSAIITKLQGMEGYEIEVRELASGDYLLREDYPVERKSASDFVASIMDRRIFEQTAKMKGEFGRATFIIEGDVYNTRSQIKPDALTGAISYLAVIEDVQVLTTTSPANTSALLATMARHLQQGLGYEVALRSARPKDLRSQAQFVIEGLPGIGPIAAKALLAHFGSIHNIMQATSKELQAAPRIGAKTADQIRALCESRYLPGGKHINAD